MGYRERKTLIERLEQARGSRVITCYLGDRATHPEGVPGFAIGMTMPVQTHVVDLLEGIGDTQQIDLVIYTRGGATDSVWPLVNSIRSYCERFAVLVPHRAHSAGTMLCLGADEVVMSRCAELSPIDATTGNPFNPKDEANGQSIGISVEDVRAYFDLAKRLGGISDDSHKLEVFKELTAGVHPLALGNVERVDSLIRRLAEQLLLLHLDGEKDEHAINEIIESFTSKFFSHTHSVMRKEVKQLFGDWLTFPTGDVAVAMDALHEEYCKDLLLRETFNLPAVIGDQPVLGFPVVGGYIETSSGSFVHRALLNVMQRPNLPPGVQIQVPPGQPIPLVPWVERIFNFGVQEFGWMEEPTSSNEEPEPDEGAEGR